MHFLHHSKLKTSQRDRRYVQNAKKSHVCFQSFVFLLQTILIFFLKKDSNKEKDRQNKAVTAKNTQAGAEYHNIQGRVTASFSCGHLWFTYLTLAKCLWKTDLKNQAGGTSSCKTEEQRVGTIIWHAQDQLWQGTILECRLLCFLSPVFVLGMRYPPEAH